MKLLSKREWTFLAFILAYSFIPTFGGLLRIGELTGGIAIIPGNPRAMAEPLPILLHIVSSFCFCLFGSLQFLPTMRRHAIDWHRFIGKVVAFSGCVSALTGLWMTVWFTFPEALQGPLLYWARIILSISMVGLIIGAVVLARKGNIGKHSSAILRAYAIGQGASTQAVLGILWIFFTGTEPAGLARDLLMVSAWGINLLVAEYLIAETSVLMTSATVNRTATHKLPNPAFKH